MYDDMCPVALACHVCLCNIMMCYDEAIRYDMMMYYYDAIYGYRLFLARSYFKGFLVVH